MMKRPMAMFERAMYLEGSLYMNVMITVRIRGSLKEQQLRHALARIQEKHGTLRCLIVQEGGRPYFVEQAQPPAIPIRIVERSSDDDWFDVSMQDSLQRFDGSKLPLARLVWLRGELEHELLLICSHALCDGKSLLLLLQQILQLCDQPDADIGTPTTLNSLEEVFPSKVLADRGLRRHIRWRVALLKLTMKFTPLSKQRWTYGDIYRSLWQLDEQISQSLVARCRAEGVSVFAALAVAFLQAFEHVCGLEWIEMFEGSIDVRRYLPGLRTDSLFAVAPTIQLSLRKLGGLEGASSDFWTLARAMKQDMVKKIECQEAVTFKLFLGLEQLHDKYDRMLAQAQSKRAGRKVTLSYVGKLDLETNYSNFFLQDVCDISGMFSPTPANLVVVYSFAGRFYFSLSSDESSLPYKKAMQIRHQVVDILTLCTTTQQTATMVQADMPTSEPARVS